VILRPRPTDKQNEAVQLFDECKSSCEESPSADLMIAAALRKAHSKSADSPTSMCGIATSRIKTNSCYVREVFKSVVSCKETDKNPIDD
jgi:hypothetical protein